jgi:hypothetical protein
LGNGHVLAALALVARFNELKDRNDVIRGIQTYEALLLSKESQFATLWQFATALLCGGRSTDKILAGSIYTQGTANRVVVAPTFRQYRPQPYCLARIQRRHRVSFQRRCIELQHSRSFTMPFGAIEISHYSWQWGCTDL